MARYLLFSLTQREIRVARVGVSTARLRGPPGGLDSLRGFASSNARPRNYLHKSIVSTLHYQKSLPRLPIPKLEDSVKRYLQAQMPLLSEEQFRQTEGFSQSFKTGIGKELQRMLVSQDKKNKHTSYISGLWLDTYLTLRSPLAFSSNVGLAFHPDPNPGHNDQLIRATNLTISALRFLKTFRDGYLEPEVLHLYPEKTDTEGFKKLIRWVPQALVCTAASMVNVYPMDMSQNFRLFSTTRLPKFYKDKLHTDEKARHLLVLRRGNFYVFDVLDRDGNIVKAAEIQARLGYILADDCPIPEFPLAYLTSENRDTWAQLRQSLQVSDNKNTLKKVETAVFCLCLDDFPIQNPDHLSHNILHGDGMNRWFDKSFNLILTQDGQAAVHFERSWGDATTHLRFLEYIFKDSSHFPAVIPWGQQKTGADNSLAPVKKLNFVLDDSLKAGIVQARARFNALSQNLAVRLCRFQQGGKKFLKNQGVSPDAVIQLSLQMAFLGQYNATVPTTESCSIAAFKHGRTETLHVASVHTKRCAEAFIRQPFEHSVGEFQNMIADCSRHHVKLIREATAGHGFDGHLRALHHLATTKGDWLPDFFFDSAYNHLNHSILATSLLASPSLKAGVFPPAVSSGFGIAYSVEPKALQFNISCSSGQSLNEFQQNVKRCLEKIWLILEGKPIIS
ncbi:carnitine O-palmitoyltransferase 2, mitochondrial-like [Tachyglossus aculeatus]|uniref:carnitine O-palmitoyltransferase 2, mitochondrial-like n=1 Tax=Tachyglossus aculeatus TaxID=9261 RepID=UPI0018F69987|nr:carnitine O-palmitoyltransferase 2, mitochondrial-like [Tachyglossus aculeatus]